MQKTETWQIFDLKIVELILTPLFISKEFFFTSTRLSNWLHKFDLGTKTGYCQKCGQGKSSTGMSSILSCLPCTHSQLITELRLYVPISSSSAKLSDMPSLTPCASWLELILWLTYVTKHWWCLKKLGRKKSDWVQEMT